MNVWSEMGMAAKLSVVIAFVPAIMGSAYAIWPNEAKLALMRPMSLAGLFAGLGGLTTGVINALTYASRQGGPIPTGPLLAGFAESLVPLCVAFGSLTFAWLVVAAGMRRHP